MSKSTITGINSFSLLSPCERDLYFKLSKNTENDLAVSFLTQSISSNSSEEIVLRRILLEMPVSEKTIRYRRAIYSELRDNSELCEELYNIIESMHFYATNRLVKFEEGSTIMELLTRLRDLDGYVTTVLRIKDVIRQYLSVASERKQSGSMRFARPQGTKA